MFEVFGRKENVETKTPRLCGTSLKLGDCFPRGDHETHTPQIADEPLDGIHKPRSLSVETNLLSMRRRVELISQEEPDGCVVVVVSDLRSDIILRPMTEKEAANHMATCVVKLAALASKNHYLRKNKRGITRVT